MPDNHPKASSAAPGSSHEPDLETLRFALFSCNCGPMNFTRRTGDLLPRTKLRSLRGLDALGVQPPHGFTFEVRQPHRAEPHPDSVPAVAYELLHHLVGHRID